MRCRIAIPAGSLLGGFRAGWLLLLFVQVLRHGVRCLVQLVDGPVDVIHVILACRLLDALERLQPRTLRELLETLNPDSAARLKAFLTTSLLTVLARDDTARTINGILSSQVDRFLVTPIGRLADHMPAGAIDKASAALTEKIVAAARERLPAAIAEFDVGGLVRQKVSDYPIEKLEALVLSVAQHHLKTIELFGAVIGFWIGVGQAIYFWFTYVPKR